MYPPGPNVFFNHSLILVSSVGLLTIVKRISYWDFIDEPESLVIQYFSGGKLLLGTISFVVRTTSQNIREELPYSNVYTIRVVHWDAELFVLPWYCLFIGSPIIPKFSRYAIYTQFIKTASNASFYTQVVLLFDASAYLVCRTLLYRNIKRSTEHSCGIEPSFPGIIPGRVTIH